MITAVGFPSSTLAVDFFCTVKRGPAHTKSSLCYFLATVYCSRASVLETLLTAWPRAAVKTASYVHVPLDLAISSRYILLYPHHMHTCIKLTRAATKWSAQTRLMLQTATHRRQQRSTQTDTNTSTQRNLLAWPHRRRGLASDGVRYAGARSGVGRRVRSVAKLRLEWYRGGVSYCCSSAQNTHEKWF